MREVELHATRCEPGDEYGPVESTVYGSFPNTSRWSYEMSVNDRCAGSSGGSEPYLLGLKARV